MAQRRRKKDDEPMIKLYAGTGRSEDYEQNTNDAEEETPHGIPQKLYADYEEDEENK